MAAITTAISTAAIGCPAADLSAVTDAVAGVVGEMALYVARKPPDVALASAAAAAAAIANIMDSLALPIDASDIEPTHRHNVVIAGMQIGEHLVSHLPWGSYDPYCVVGELEPVYKLIVGPTELMATVSAASAPALASALDSAIISVTSAVAAAGQSGPAIIRPDRMLDMAHMYGENARRIARAFAGGVNAVDNRTRGFFLTSPSRLGNRTQPAHIVCTCQCEKRGL